MLWMTSDQSVGAENQKNEECEADYQQFKKVKEIVDTFAHGGSPICQRFGAHW